MGLVSIRKCLTSSLVKSPTGKKTKNISINVEFVQIFSYNEAKEFLLLTFFVLLDSRWRTGHLHGQTIGPAEGMAVPDDEGPGLPVL